MTRRTYRWFRFALFGLLWLGAGALQTYVSDVGMHGVMVGAYLPGWLLAIAAIPPWTLLGPALLDAIVALLAQRLPRAFLAALGLLNIVLLAGYACIGVAVIFYIAFANSGIS